MDMNETRGYINPRHLASMTKSRELQAIHERINAADGQCDNSRLRLCNDAIIHVRDPNFCGPAREISPP